MYTTYMSLADITREVTQGQVGWILLSVRQMVEQQMSYNEGQMPWCFANERISQRSANYSTLDREHI